MIDAIHLRRRVRLVLSALPKPQPEALPTEVRRLSESMLFDKLLPDFPDLEAEPGALSTAINWNYHEGYVDQRWNKDLKRNEWCLTTEGWRKEGLA